MTRGRRFIAILFCSAALIQCANIFEPLTPKDTNAAYLYSARLKIDAGQYAEALTDLGQIDAEYASQNDVRITFASAYAGECGMEFIPFFNSISTINLTGTTIFKYLRASFTDKATTPTSCTEAEKKLKEIGATSAARLAAMNGEKEVNMLMAILSMAKIGSYLRVTSDVDGTNSLGDGTTDASFDSCDSTKLTDTQVLEIATGFGLLVENLSAILGDGSSTATTLAVVTAAFTALCGPTPPAGGCNILDYSTLTDDEKTAIINTYRDLLKSDQGIEALPIGTNACDPTQTIPPPPPP